MGEVRFESYCSALTNFSFEQQSSTTLADPSSISTGSTPLYPVNSTSNSSTVPDDTDFIIEETTVINCPIPPNEGNGTLSIWQFIGGIVLGICATVLVQVCFSVYRSGKRKSYNEPYSFDNFVNP